ncbi:arylacetamide deacetylase-like 4 [Octodon degus]|uniref:Arylacetamide deacetylase-like 4 n=1 Tax=Octodon degus TaxID=10160 RepID=A0A6P3FKN7_OCTDE|nr:arylacetamide deacetylase-like 4 [Octodon degus]
MAVLLLVPLLGLLVFLLGVFIWVVFKELHTAEVPSTMKYPIKLRAVHCVFQYAITLGNILEKLRICSMPSFVRFMHDRVAIIKKDPKLLVTNLHFGTVPVRLFQPKASSCSPRRGVIFYHGGGGLLGSLDSYHSLCSYLARETDSVVLSVGYRKYPDYHFPIVYRDCLNATIHFLKRLQTYGVEASRVVICGESMGASTVAMVTQALVGRTSLPQIRAQILISPAVQLLNLQLPSFCQNKNVPFLTQEIFMTLVCKYMATDLSWKDALWNGACMPPENWKKYQRWISSDNIPDRFKNKGQEPQFPGPFIESAYLETKHFFDVRNAPILAEDEIISQLPEAFLVSYGHDILRDDTLLYKKRLEDQGVPVSWYHIEDGFHGCIVLFDRKLLSFPCSQDTVNSVVSYIKGI